MLLQSHQDQLQNIRYGETPGAGLPKWGFLNPWGFMRELQGVLGTQCVLDSLFLHSHLFTEVTAFKQYSIKRMLQDLTYLKKKV